MPVADVFPGCCGATIIHDFRLLEPKRKEEQALLDALYEHDEEPGRWVFVILNHRQRPRFEKMLLKQGFKLVLKGPNPSHGDQTKLFFYARTTTKTMIKKARARRERNY